MQSQRAQFKGETEIAQPGLLLEISGEVPQGTQVCTLLGSLLPAVFNLDIDDGSNFPITSSLGEQKKVGRTDVSVRPHLAQHPASAHPGELRKGRYSAGLLR